MWLNRLIVWSGVRGLWPYFIPSAYWSANLISHGWIIRSPFSVFLSWLLPTLQWFAKWRVVQLIVWSGVWVLWSSFIHTSMEVCALIHTGSFVQHSFLIDSMNSCYTSKKLEFWLKIVKIRWAEFKDPKSAAVNGDH